MKMIKEKFNKGFTLIEVLISIIVLSIGLLGVASLQLLGMKNNNNAYLRTQATLLAYDFSDVLRTHITTLNNSPGAFPNPYNLPSSVSDSAAKACSGSTTKCTASTMAAADLNRWSRSVIDTLPDGSGVVARNGDIFTLTLTWTEQDNSDGDGAVTKSFITRFRP